MKRATELVPLSREHHEALVLGRRACEPRRPHAGPAQLLPHVLRRWAEHFEPHFAREERQLFPLAERLLDLSVLAAALADATEDLPCSH